MGTFGFDKDFFRSQGIRTIELADKAGKGKVLVVPSYQGRVMTTTADGDNGFSFGWINHDFIKRHEFNPQFNPFGGEERFWIGPEGGPNSWYFKKGEEQIYSNWNVPAAIDTDVYDIVEQSSGHAVFTKNFSVENARGLVFNIGVKRAIDVLEEKDVNDVLGVPVPASVKYVAYRTANELTNNDTFEWNKGTGMPSVWLLGMFNPTPTTVVFIPYNKEFQGRAVNDEYFGKIPSDRLICDNGMLYFKIDGKYRSKLGLPSGSAKDICGSYDYERKILTVIKYTIPAEDAAYVNAQWGPQDDPFAGDVINAYNDGPTEDGTVMGPFYEMETSSPAANLKPAESLTHVQCTVHFHGDEQELEPIARKLFGVDLSSFRTIF